jgi:alkanesulfonate monooxygenase SsuD/methylene tetrahydromethanopterin reductase-like flavin-dependent oxidoreductase (luciferase family)
MIKSWVFEFFLAPHHLAGEAEPLGSAAYFDFHLDLWSRAEDLGYDGIFLSEHHFGVSYSPSPNLLLPVIAQRTRTLRLGVMGVVAPYYTPWRLLEEFGMLDNLLGGRLEIGTSVGVPAELARIGMTPAEARARFDEAMQIIDAGLATGVVSHRGEFWSFENLQILPRPVQQPAPPRWTTVVSVESARKAARRGSKISTGFVSTETAKAIFDAYNEAADKAGHPTGPEQLALRRQVTIDVDAVASDARSGQFAKAFRMTLETHDARATSPGRPALDQPGAHEYALSDDEFVSGSPERVAETIARQCAASGAGHFMAVFSGHQGLDGLARAWELFGREVNPRLKRG